MNLRTAVLFLYICLAVAASQAERAWAFSATRGLEIKEKPILGAPGVDSLYSGSHALVVGVGEYVHWPDIPGAREDAAMVKQALLDRGFSVRLVVDPDSDELERAFEDFIDAHGFEEGNRLLVFFAGHGHSFQGETEGYLAPTDAPDPRKDRTGFLRTSQDMTQVLAWAKRMRAKHALFVFDSCFSGTVFTTRLLPGEQAPRHILTKASEPVRQFITAGGADDTVPAESVFAKLFLRGLDGEGDLNGDGYITGAELGMYLSDHVPYYNPRQRPQYGVIRDPKLDRGDFVFASPKGSGHSRIETADIGPQSPASDGRLYVETDPPGATVSLAGEKAPYKQGMSLPSGAYTVVVSKSGYADRRLTAMIGPGRDLTLAVHLRRTTPADRRPSTIKAGENWVEPTTGMEFVRAPGGCFNMGDPYGDSDERRVHTVCLEDFWIGKYEVTQGQWRALFGYNRPGCDEGPAYPVRSLSWHQAREFVARMNAFGNALFALPSEAQWEYACRSAGRDKPDAITAHRRSATRGAGVSVRAVGYGAVNSLGACDMPGGVWEWVRDDYTAKFAAGLTDRQAVRRGGAGRKVIRGGSDVGGNARSVRCTNRGSLQAEQSGMNLGFRLVRVD